MTKLISAKEAKALTDKKVREVEEYRKSIVTRRLKEFRDDVIKRIYEATQKGKNSIELTFIRPETISYSLKEELISSGYKLTETGSYVVVSGNGLPTHATTHTCDVIVVSWDN